jgi:hypothetical protein
MYAKLKFNSGVSTALAIRDIVRLITESAAGSASLSNLGSIDTSSSTLTAGVNSGWTLYTGQSIPANSTAASATSDSFYTLQATSATNSRTKYCAIHGNCHFSSGSGMTYTTNNAAGILISNVNDPTLSNANANYNFGSGYNSTSTSYMNDMGFNVPSMYASPMYIWADPTRIIMYAANWMDGRGPLFTGNFEGNQGPLDVWKTKCPTMTLFDSTYNIHASAGHEGMGRGDSYFTANYGRRWAQIHNITSHGMLPGATAAHLFFSADSYTGHSLDYQSPRAMDTSLTEMNVANLRKTYGDYGRANSSILHNGNTPANYAQGLATHKGFDSSGNSTLVAEPLYFMASGGSPTSYNFSNLTNTWRVPSNIGTNGEVVTIGSDTYTYITMSAYALHSYLVKNT